MTSVRTTNMVRQRASTSSSTTESKNPKKASMLPLQSSDDEAPEEVTFDDSRTQALLSMKRALDSARREKELLKEKRRKRQELFQEQKKRKFLPADVLEEIEPAAPKELKSSEDEAEEEEGEEEEGDQLERDHQTPEENLKLSHVRKVRGNYTVTTGKEAASSSVQQQAAMDFLQARLYGPGSCRTTSNQLLSLQNKTSRNRSAAVQFVKKDWACKQKAKAEKLKKRWIHKQQVPST